MDIHEDNGADNKQLNTIFSSNDPLSEIGKWIYNLIKENSSLRYELDQLRKEFESDIEKMLLDLIEVMDAFENLFQRIKAKEEFLDQQTKTLVGNFQTIYKMLIRTLKMFEVTQIETIIGEKVNPYIHNIVEIDERTDFEDGTIVEVIRKGYFWKRKLLRPVDVKVAKKINQGASYGENSWH
jgi:molecular chaperone GrpE